MLAGLPLPIRILFDAVVVIVFIAAGEQIARLPYEPDAVDEIMVLIFQGVFATIGFAVIAWFAEHRRARHVALTVLMVWAITGFMVILQLLPPPFWLIIVLPALAISASLGGAMALLVEKFARE